MSNKIIPINDYKIINLGKEKIGVDCHVQLRITETCDLQCSYCHWHSGKHYAYDDIIKTIDILFKFFIKQKYKTVLFYYHGGEATRHPKILQILQYIKEKGHDHKIVALNEMQTNLTLPNSKLQPLIDYCDQLDISLHYNELIKRPYKKKSFDLNYKWLVDNQIKINNFDVMLEDITITSLSDFYEEVNSYLEYENIINSEMIYSFFEYETLIEKSHKEYYNRFNKTEQLYLIDGIEYNTNDLFKNELDCRGWKCDAGKTNIYVNGDGNVFTCAAPMTNYVNNKDEIPYTNLLTDTMSISKMVILSNTGTICKWDSCAGDFYINRKK